MPADNDMLDASAEPDTDTQQGSEPANADATASGDAQVTQDAQAATPANAAPSDQQDDGSLTPPHSEKETQQQAPPARDWTKDGPVLEKRYRDLMSHTDKQINDWRGKLQTNEQKMQEVLTWKQEQEKRAQALQLKEWNKDHPDHGKFNSMLERARTVEAQLRRVPTMGPDGQPLAPQQVEAMKQAIMSAISPEEQQTLQNYRENRENFQRDWFTDPQATLRPMVEQMAAEQVQKAIDKMQAQASVQQDFADPTLAPLIKEHGQDFARALQEMPQRPYDYAKQMMMLYAENQALKAGKQSSDTQATHAGEQKRLAQGRAAITRDPGAPKIDPYTAAVKEAKDRGISPASPAFTAILQKHER